ncbi:MAG: SMC-Scp complex subunit ScpB [Thermomicrobiales bacterium]|nr:SMC-Scp complex subunit ScpB [Thermomicrobiales bacterium]
MPVDYTTEETGALIEAILLVSTEPPTIDEIAVGTEISVKEIEEGLAWLEQQTDRGWLIQRHGRRLSLVTHPRYADRVRMFLGLDREAKLSSASLETLALVAYQQPVTRSEIEAVRGVDSSGVLATLHARGMIEPVARLATVGNPIQYGTTAIFLSHFGLQSLDDLPPIGIINGKDGHEMLAAAQASAMATETADEA